MAPQQKKVYKAKTYTRKEFEALLAKFGYTPDEIEEMRVSGRTVLPEIDPDEFEDDDLEDEEEKKPEMTASERAEMMRKRDDLFRTGSDYKNTTRSDIVGIDNVLAEIDDVIHWLRNAKAYQELGARLEPGVIFEGDPGTGKTLVASWIANESGAFFVNFRDFPHAGGFPSDEDISDFFDRLRAHYAKTGQPIVAFWDEFETSAKSRDDCTPEQAQAVSELTDQLDGIRGKNEGLFLIGCTNYMYQIDNALKRSGRMGLHIEFSPPDRKGKQLLLEHYLRDYPTDGDINCFDLSFFFNSRDNAADVEEACMEAWRYAVRRAIRAESKQSPLLSNADLIEVFLKRLVGPPSTFVNMTMDDRIRVAIHEVGHALAAMAFGIPVRLITVQPGKKALGKVVTAEIEEFLGTIEENKARIRVNLGSIAAEEITEVPASTGSTQDLRTATGMAIWLVDSLYEGKAVKTRLFSLLAAADNRSQYGEVVSPTVSQATIDEVDTQAQNLLNEMYGEVRSALNRIGQKKIVAIAQRVNKSVTLTGDEFKTVVEEIAGDVRVTNG